MQETQLLIIEIALIKSFLKSLPTRGSFFKNLRGSMFQFIFYTRFYTIVKYVASATLKHDENTANYLQITILTSSLGDKEKYYLDNVS